MKLIDLVKLLLKPELWEKSGRSFEDELQLKNGDVRFYSNEAVIFRNKQDDELYVVGVFAWFLIFPLSQMCITTNA